MEPYHKQIQTTEKLNEAAEPTPASAVESDLPTRLRTNSSQEMLKELLAFLRAQQWLLLSLHWQVKGTDFYELHLLFERLYGALGGQIDGLAEKMIGYYSVEIVEMNDSMTRAQKWLKEWKGEPVDAALASEKQLQALLRQIYEAMKNKKELSLGLDDFLMALASDHETHLYLLGQVKR